MKTRSLSLLGISLLGLVLAIGMGCGKEEEQEDALAVIPDGEMIGLGIGEVDSETFALQESALSAGEASANSFMDYAEQTMTKLNELLKSTHDKLTALTSAEPQVVTLRTLECKQWTKLAGEVTWRLTSCTRDKALRSYAYALQGAKVATPTEADYKVAFAGYGFVLERFDGKKRGKGFIGYNFDNLSALTGQPLTGKLGIGYRAAGRVRQVNLGFLKFTSAAITNPLNAIFGYKHIVDLGSLFRFGIAGDFAKKDGDAYVPGQDGFKEFGHVIAGWHKDGAGRIALRACDNPEQTGNTFDPRLCVRTAQCINAAGDIKWNGNFDDQTGVSLTWDTTQCPTVPATDAELIPDGEIDQTSESNLDEDAEGVGAPSIEVPAADEQE